MPRLFRATLPQRRFLRALVLALYATCLLCAPLAAAPLRQETPAALDTGLNSAFTYQGRLDKGSAPVNATCAMTFSLFDALTAGNKIGNDQAINTITVSNGLFTVLLDGGGEFGAGAFDGNARFLQIAVLCPGDATAVTLPRQQLTAAPYALTSLSTEGLQGRPVSASAPTTGQALAWDGTQWKPQTFSNEGSHDWSSLSGIPAGFADNVDNEGPVPDWNSLPHIPAGFADNVDNDSGGDITGVAAGSGLTGGGTAGNVSLALNTGVTDSRYWRLTGDGALPSTALLGTTDATTLTVGVNNKAALRIVPSVNSNNGETDPTLIGGNAANEVAAGAYGSVIAGGGTTVASQENQIFDTFGVIGGGIDNQVGLDDSDVENQNLATIGGGKSNLAIAPFAVVSGGFSNNAGGQSSVIGGGVGNETDAKLDTIGGGEANFVSAQDATIPGGEDASASVFGQFAYADGTFTGDNAGAAQTSIYVLRGEGAGNIIPTLDGAGEQLKIPNRVSMAFTVLLVGRATGATELTAAYRIDGGLLVSDDGSTVSVGRTITTLVESSMAAMLSADAITTSGVLQIVARNSTGLSMRWVATVYTSEVRE